MKNQGHCGSCGTFAATGAIEGQYFLKTGELVSLSEQNLVDCASNKDSCSGASAPVVYEYVMKHAYV